MSSNYRHSSLDRERIMKSLAGEFFKKGTKGSWDTLKLISSGEFIAPGVWADQERQDSLDPEKVRANRNLWRSIDWAFDSFSEPFGPKDAHRIITYWTHLSGACSDPQGWVRRGDISFRPTEEDRRKEIPGYRAWKHERAKKNPAPVVVAAIIQAFLPLIMSLGTRQINAYKKASTEDQIKMLKKWSMFLSPPVRLALQHKKSARNIATKLSALLNDPETMANLKEAGKAGIEVGQAYRGAKGKAPRRIAAKRNTREVNPYSRRYTLASFTKKYFPGERVSPGVAKSFWDDFRFGYQGGLSRYIKETTWVDGEQLAKKNPKMKEDEWYSNFSEEELRYKIEDLEEKLADSDRLDWSHELDDWLADTRIDLADLRRELKWQEAKKGLREGKLVGTSIPLRDYADVYPRDLLKRFRAKKNPVGSGQKFVIVDVSIPGGRWVDEIIYDNARKADREAAKLLKEGHDVQVIDAVWFGPAESRLRTVGMRNNPRKYGTKRLKKKLASRFKVFHADHGISKSQMGFIERKLEDVAPQGFFIKQINLLKRLGSVPNAMYGPVAGDPPVSEKDVHYLDRAGRGWEDRMVDWPPRASQHVQVIGIRDGANFTLFTVYGGPLAPQHADDPTNHDPEASRRFWSQHALSSQQWAAKKNGPTLRKPHYPFAEKEKQYAEYTTEALYYSMNDAMAASRAQQDWNEAGANWYLDDYHTIVKEIERRKRRR
jgi:hypothetical protein